MAIGVIDAGWVQDRWFQRFDGRIGVPAQAIVLGYSSPVTPQRVLVRTQAIGFERAEPALAVAAMHLLLEAATGAARLTDKVSTSRKQRLIAEAGDSYPTWETVRWRLNDRVVTASIRRFAGAWAGFTVVDASRGAAVAGNRIDPSDLSLGDVCSPDGFNVNFFDRQPLAELHAHQPPGYTVDDGDLNVTDLYEDQIWRAVEDDQ